MIGCSRADKEIGLWRGSLLNVHCRFSKYSVIFPHFPMQVNTPLKGSSRLAASRIQVLGGCKQAAGSPWALIQNLDQQ